MNFDKKVMNVFLFQSFFLSDIFRKFQGNKKNEWGTLMGDNMMTADRNTEITEFGVTTYRFLLSNPSEKQLWKMYAQHGPPPFQSLRQC